MRILICEDEAPASRHLETLVNSIRPEAQILDIVETGEEARDLISRKDPELILMDIELADGPCFETLDNVQITQPIIFTTAYDEFAIKAFRMNSIDYLVKPITLEKLEQAFQKLEAMQSSLSRYQPITISKELFEQPAYKERFLVKIGQRLLPITVDKIAYFYTSDKLVWLVTSEKKRYVVNYSLTDLEELLDPNRFFRLNRQYLASHGSIDEIESYFKGQVVVKLNPGTDEEIVISRQQTPKLKEWLGYH